MEHHGMKTKVEKEYKRRLKLVLKSELNARNKIAAINTLAFPVVSYSYGIVNWKVQEIKDLDRVTRKMLCMYRMHAKKADVDRIYLPCSEGGRGLINLEREYKSTIVGLNKYLTTKDDYHLSAVLRYYVNKALYSIPKEAEKYLIEVNTENILDNGHLSAVAQADKLKKIFKQNYWKMMRKV